VLVFLSGEREIRDAADGLGEHLSAGHRGRSGPVEIVPLYGRLSAAEQHRVFAPHTGRRVVLATNVAETSLTVPGIRYVVDTGTARISRYSQRLKVQRLPIEAVSQASANQRAGRCGRTADGVCIRLYAEDDFESRPRFTDPEILRTHLASVVLQMAALGLGPVADFGFVDPPDTRSIRDGVQLLEELGALDPSQQDAGRRLTAVGRRLARLPLDPRLGRMVLAAEALGCVREVVVIAAALAIQDPRERPADKEQAADAAHRRFQDPASDLMTYLALWQHLRTQQRALSSSRFRRMCRDEFLHYLRVREWQDLVAQLRRVLGELDVPLSSSPDDPDRVHQALLAGLLSHVGLRQRESRDYLGARGARFAIFPGSGLVKARPDWVMAGELVETSRLWGRQVARIDPAWIEPLAGHLVKRTYAEPHWERKLSAAVALETVTLYGIPIVTGRRVPLSQVDPVTARDLFIRHALVEGDWDTRHHFFRDNRALLAEVEGLEERTRRRDIIVDEEALVAFYAERIPARVVSGRHFDTWWKQERRTRPDLLAFDRDLLVRDGAGVVDSADYPDSWTVGDSVLPLSYAFDPGEARDGVTVDVPLRLLHHLKAADFAWQVPGLRVDLVTALLRSLPKALRRQLVPAPDHAARLVRCLDPVSADGGLLAALGNEVRRSTGVLVPADAWTPDRLPEHMRLTFRVVNEHGREVAVGKDLEVLQHQLRQRLRETLTEASSGLERTGMTSWDLAEPLPRMVTTTRAAHTVTGYPTLVDEVADVAVRVVESEAVRDATMLRGTVRLLRLTTASPLAPVVRGLDNTAKLALGHQPYPSVPALLEDCADTAAAHLVRQHGGVAWDGGDFARLRQAVRADLVPATESVVTTVLRVLTDARTARVRLADVTSPALTAVRDDIGWQLDDLVGDGFVSAAGWDRLPDLTRYARGVLVRLERLAGDPRRDLARLDELLGVVSVYEQARDAVPVDRQIPAAVTEARWLLEELRLGLFAPSVRAAPGVSAQRIRRSLAAAQP
ncbi:MAG: ATP-dependent RNA helicase HrpA, partial [Actinomycetota bacterium]|nr:ATP-dependent RNA helicase HrpA [Actinomycetota bacterium]